MRSPYDLIKRLHVTEKSKMLESLSLRDTKNRKKSQFCRFAKYVFVVDGKANKIEIAKAIEEIYASKNVRVSKVNTICVKPKVKGTRRGRPGKTSFLKKAVVTLKEGCSLV